MRKNSKVKKQIGVSGGSQDYEELCSTRQVQSYSEKEGLYHT